MGKIYESVVSNIGGRIGEVYSPDESFLYRVVSPTSKVENATNPEELFAAAYSSCFNGALKLVMSRKNINSSSVVTAKVSLHENGKNNFSISVILEVLIKEIDQSLAKTLVEEADQICPYSKAIKNNVIKNIHLITE
ncbi:hypothetical protein IGJ91_002941 [Enterococcus sp. DIV0765f]|uniref:Ohr family peroxiredoxin n=1 Tax=Enterococcus sp. DIV0765f TaxID=2774783 RepID=UPI003F252CFE